MASWGKSAKGTFGTGVASEWFWEKKDELGMGRERKERSTLTQDLSFERKSVRRLSASAVHLATAAMPPVMPLSMSISTSMPMPYTGTRFPAVFE